MNDFQDGHRSKLRAVVASVDGDVSELLRQDTLEGYARTTRALLAHWANLVESLALGPEPEVRSCPFCQEVGMKAATRCGYCWKRLLPPPGSA